MRRNTIWSINKIGGTNEFLYLRNVFLTEYLFE
jgi:hypothetical protein